jgi:hypothetical protein
MEYLSVQDRLLFLEEYSSLAQPSLDAVLSWFGLQSMLGITPREMLAITFNPTRYPDHQQGGFNQSIPKAYRRINTLWDLGYQDLGGIRAVFLASLKHDYFPELEPLIEVLQEDIPGSLEAFFPVLTAFFDPPHHQRESLSFEQVAGLYPLLKEYLSIEDTLELMKIAAASPKLTDWRDLNDPLVRYLRDPANHNTFQELFRWFYHPDHQVIGHYVQNDLYATTSEGRSFEDLFRLSLQTAYPLPSGQTRFLYISPGLLAQMASIGYSEEEALAKVQALSQEPRTSLPHYPEVLEDYLSLYYDYYDTPPELNWELAELSSRLMTRGQKMRMEDYIEELQNADQPWPEDWQTQAVQEALILASPELYDYFRSFFSDTQEMLFLFQGLAPNAIWYDAFVLDLLPQVLSAQERFDISPRDFLGLIRGRPREDLEAFIQDAGALGALEQLQQQGGLTMGEALDFYFARSKFWGIIDYSPLYSLEADLRILSYGHLQSTNPEGGQ